MNDFNFDDEDLQPSARAMEIAERMGPPMDEITQVAYWLARQPRHEFGALPQGLLAALAEEKSQFELARHWAETRSPDTEVTGPDGLRDRLLHEYLEAKSPRVEVKPSIIRDARHLVREANQRLVELGWKHHRFTTLTGRAAQKLEYEKHVHPKSRDWDGAPEGALELYEEIVERHDQGGDLSVAWLETYRLQVWTTRGRVDCDVKALCAWLSSPAHPLIGSLNGQVVLISNRELDRTPISEENPDGMTPAELLDERYPGWKLDWRNPLAGRSWTAWTHAIVAERVYQEVIARGGQDVETDAGLRKLKRLSASDVARIMNSEEFRATDERLPGLRAAGINQARLALKRMREAWLHMFGGTDDNGHEVQGCDDCVDGQLHLYQIHVAKDSERYMQDHGFVGEPAAYGCGPEPEERREERLQRRRIRAQARESRQALRLMEAWTAALR